MAKPKPSYCLLILFLATLLSFSAFSQVRIANTPGVPNAGAMLDVESSNRGFLMPRIYLSSTTMQLNGATPAEGTFIFSTNWDGDGSLGGLFVWKNGIWISFNEAQKITPSYIRVFRNSDQAIVSRNDFLSWEAVSEVQQPSTDAPMWSSSNPTKIIIRRKGWYFVSGSFRFQSIPTGDQVYIAITKNLLQLSAVGFDNQGTNGAENRRVCLNTSVMIQCDVNDEISLLCYVTNNASTSSTTVLKTTQMNVTQLPIYIP